MELLQLRYFITVAETLNISRAAQYHMIPQPAMSQTISRLEKELGICKAEFTLSIMSFGFKRGVPFEADVVLDMRFSPNPYYEKELRHLSGKDEPVQEYVLADEDVRVLLNGAERMLDRLIPRYMEQEKRSLVLAFGCTGGRHRSVCAAEEMYARVKDKYSTTLFHRDLSEEGTDIKERTGGERS